MIALYYAPGSASMVVHQTLLELGAPHELRKVDLDAGAQRAPEYLKLNPNGVVPTMVLDGHPHYEAAALTMLLVERHPEAKLAPASGEDRAFYMQWFFHFANTLQPAYRLWFYPHDLPHADPEAVKTDARARIEATWDRVDAHLATRAARGPYMLGESFGALDMYTTMLMRWSRNMPKPATTWPRLAALAALVKARPSWKKMYEVEGLTEWP